MPHRQIQPLYETLVGRTESAADKDLKGDEVTKRLLALAVGCKAFLGTIGTKPLESKVPGKSYFMFVDGARNKTSRPVNEGLFLDALDSETISVIWLIL